MLRNFCREKICGLPGLKIETWGTRHPALSNGECRDSHLAWSFGLVTGLRRRFGGEFPENLLRTFTASRTYNSQMNVSMPSSTRVLLPWLFAASLWSGSLLAQENQSPTASQSQPTTAKAAPVADTPADTLHAPRCRTLVASERGLIDGRCATYDDVLAARGGRPKLRT